MAVVHHGGRDTVRRRCMLGRNLFWSIAQMSSSRVCENRCDEEATEREEYSAAAADVFTHKRIHPIFQSSPWQAALKKATFFPLFWQPLSNNNYHLKRCTWQLEQGIFMLKGRFYHIFIISNLKWIIISVLFEVLTSTQKGNNAMS